MNIYITVPSADLGKEGMMKLYYDGKVVGQITTDRIMTLEEVCEILNIDLNAQDENAVGYDRDAFIMEY